MNHSICLLFIYSDQPTKVDTDVFNAIGKDFALDSAKHPFVTKWHHAMSSVDLSSVQVSRAPSQLQKQLFRIFTPRLKL
jgi:hypothetical protein